MRSEVFRRWELFMNFRWSNGNKFCVRWNIYHLIMFHSVPCLTFTYLHSPINLLTAWVRNKFNITNSENYLWYRFYIASLKLTPKVWNNFSINNFIEIVELTVLLRNSWVLVFRLKAPWWQISSTYNSW